MRVIILKKHGGQKRWNSLTTGLWRKTTHNLGLFLEGTLKRYPEIGKRPKKVLLNPPEGSIEPLQKVLSNPLLVPKKVP